MVPSRFNLPAIEGILRQMMLFDSSSLAHKQTTAPETTLVSDKEQDILAAGIATGTGDTFVLSPQGDSYCQVRDWTGQWTNKNDESRQRACHANSKTKINS